LNKVFVFKQEKITRHLWLYFSLVFLINLIFKIPYLGFSSFWYDEIVSVQSASLDFGHIKHVSEWDKNPPFYYYCLSVWIKVLNDSEFCVRLLSVIFSSLAASVLFLFSNKYFNRATAIVSGLLFLSSNILYFYSHEARAYSLVLLLSLLSSVAYFNLKDKPNKQYIIILGLINFLLIYTHYITGLVLFFQTILMMVYFDKKQKTAFGYSLLIVLGFTLLRFTKKQALLLIAFNNPENKFWLKKSDLTYLNEVLSEFFFHQILIFPLVALIVIAGAVIIKTHIKQLNFTLIYCLCVGVGSIVILFLLGKVTPIFLDRYLVFSLPFIFMLIAAGFSAINPVIIPIAVSIAFFGFSAFKIDYKTDKGMDYKNAVVFLKSIKKNDDLVIVKTKDIKALFCYYYDNHFLSSKKENLPAGEHILFCNSWEDINVNTADFKRIIVMDSFQEYNTHEADFSAQISKTRILELESKHFKGVRVRIYK
jgi:mannosyltransferase